MCNVIRYTVIKSKFSSLSLSLFNFNAQLGPMTIHHMYKP